MKKIEITVKQAEAFNRMRQTLRCIGRVKGEGTTFMTPDEIRKHNDTGLDPEEEIEMAYENIQGMAKASVAGVKAILFLITSILFISCTQKDDNPDIYHARLGKDTVSVKTIETKKDKNSYIIQEIRPLGDGIFVMRTEAWHKNTLVRMLIVYEGPQTARKFTSSLQFVTQITDSLKKSEWDRAEIARLAYIKKINPYR